jgi:hypothetical protein
MEAQTPLIIALTSIVTGTFTVFLSNFLAPRFNARYERKYRDGLVFKKTLRILMEIEIYVQRNLKLPALPYISEALLPKLGEMGYVDDAQKLTAVLPQLFQFLQPLLIRNLPDKSEALDHEFGLILNELSTVDPLLAYRISERHSISPIQNIESNVIGALQALGVTVNEEDKDVQKLREFVQSQKSKWVDDLLADLRQDILNVAARIGKKDLKEIESYFRELDVKRREHAQKFAGDLAGFIPKKTLNSTDESKS